MRIHFKRKVGEGRFGKVYKGENKETGELVAIKREDDASRWSYLQQEAAVYARLRDTVGFPNLQWFGRQGNATVLVLPYLGRSLHQLLAECGGTFTVKTVLMIAYQILDRLEFLHRKGIVHCDINPRNILVGHGRDRWTFFLVDFGLSKFYLNDEGEHVPCREDDVIVGTMRYISLNVHHKRTCSRRDDLESLAYMLIFMLRGTLPWAGLRENTITRMERKVRRLKQHTPIEEICAGVPREFQVFLQEVRKLGYDEEPKYAQYREMFMKLFRSCGFVYDLRFDWQGIERSHSAQAIRPKMPGRRPRLVVPSLGLRVFNSVFG